MANKAFVNEFSNPGGTNAIDAQFVVVNPSNSWVYSSTTSVRVTIDYADNACSIWDKVVAAIHAYDSSLIVVNGLP